MKKYSSSIGGAVILLVVTSILSRGIGFIREVVFANTFGLNRDFEIFLVAAVLPVLINSAIFYLAQNYFIPLYNKQNSVEERHLFLRNQFWFFFLLGCFLTLFLYIIENAVLKIYIGEAPASVYGTATKVYEVYLLSFPINAGYSILAAYLQAELKFRHPAISQLFLNLPIILFVMAFYNSMMILSIPIGYLAGSILQLVYLMIIVGPGLLTFSLTKGGWTLKNSVNRPLILIILIEIINQLHPFIDRYFLDEVEQGGIASLNYATVIFSLPVTIFSFAMASVIFPVLSKYINSDNPEKTNFYYVKSLRMITAAFIPITFIYLLNGDLIISLIFQRGKFNLSDTNMTYFVLQMYSISLVFYAGYAVINKMIFSSGLIKQLLILSSVLILLKIIMNAFFVEILRQDGLALSSSVSFISLSLGSYYLISRKQNIGRKSIFIKDIIFFGLLALALYVISIEFSFLFTYSKTITDVLQIVVFMVLYLLSLRFILATDKSLFSLE